MKKVLAAAVLLAASLSASAGVITDFLIANVNGGFRVPSQTIIDKDYADLSSTDRAYILDRVMQEQLAYARRIGEEADAVLARNPRAELKQLQNDEAIARRGDVAFRSLTTVGGQTVASYELREVNYGYLEATRVSINELKAGMAPATITLGSNFFAKRTIKTTIGQKQAVMALMDQYDRGFQSLFTQVTKYEAQEADRRAKDAMRAQQLADVDRQIAALNGCRRTFFVRTCQEQAASLYVQRVAILQQ
ncbi:hypothetical protein JXVLWARM_CDS_0047 [Burkholderia phage Bm1]